MVGLFLFSYHVPSFHPNRLCRVGKLKPPGLQLVLLTCALILTQILVSTSAEEVMFSPAICWVIYWYNFKQDYTRTTKPISTKLGIGVGTGPGNNPFDFGEDRDFISHFFHHVLWQIEDLGYQTPYFFLLEQDNHLWYCSALVEMCACQSIYITMGLYVSVCLFSRVMQKPQDGSPNNLVEGCMVLGEPIKFLCGFRSGYGLSFFFFILFGWL